MSRILLRDGENQALVGDGEYIPQTLVVQLKRMICIKELSTGSVNWFFTIFSFLSPLQYHHCLYSSFHGLLGRHSWSWPGCWVSPLSILPNGKPQLGL